MTLREAREKAGCTQNDVAYFTGYDRKSISRWENGQPPRVDHFLELCELYRVDPVEMLEEWRT